MRNTDSAMIIKCKWVFMNRALIIMLLLQVLLYSCSSKESMEQISTQTLNCDNLHTYLVEVVSSGAFEKYNSAITVFAEDNDIVVNTKDTTNYVTQHPLFLESTNSFLVEASNKPYLRIILGETVEGNTAENAQIRIKIFQDDKLVQERLFTLAPADDRNIVFINIVPCE